MLPYIIPASGSNGREPTRGPNHNKASKKAVHGLRNDLRTATSNLDRIARQLNHIEAYLSKSSDYELFAIREAREQFQQAQSGPIQTPQALMNGAAWMGRGDASQIPNLFATPSPVTSSAPSTALPGTQMSTPRAGSSAADPTIGLSKQLADIQKLLEATAAAVETESQ